MTVPFLMTADGVLPVEDVVEGFIEEVMEVAELVTNPEAEVEPVGEPVAVGV